MSNQLPKIHPGIIFLQEMHILQDLDKTLTSKFYTQQFMTPDMSKKQGITIWISHMLWERFKKTLEATIFFN